MALPEATSVQDAVDTQNEVRQLLADMINELLHTVIPAQAGIPDNKSIENISLRPKSPNILAYSIEKSFVLSGVTT